MLTIEFTFISLVIINTKYWGWVFKVFIKLSQAFEIKLPLELSSWSGVDVMFAPRETFNTSARSPVIDDDESSNVSAPGKEYFVDCWSKGSKCGFNFDNCILYSHLWPCDGLNLCVGTP